MAIKSSGIHQVSSKPALKVASKAASKVISPSQEVQQFAGEEFYDPVTGEESTGTEISEGQAVDTSTPDQFDVEVAQPELPQEVVEVVYPEPQQVRNPFQPDFLPNEAGREAYEEWSKQPAARWVVAEEAEPISTDTTHEVVDPTYIPDRFEDKFWNLQDHPQQAQFRGTGGYFRPTAFPEAVEKSVTAKYTLSTPISVQLDTVITEPVVDSTPFIDPYEDIYFKEPDEPRSITVYPGEEWFDPETGEVDTGSKVPKPVKVVKVLSKKPELSRLVPDQNAVELAKERQKVVQDERRQLDLVTSGRLTTEQEDLLVKTDPDSVIGKAAQTRIDERDSVFVGAVETPYSGSIETEILTPASTVSEAVRKMTETYQGPVLNMAMEDLFKNQGFSDSEIKTMWDYVVESKEVMGATMPGPTPGFTAKPDRDEVLQRMRESTSRGESGITLDSNLAQGFRNQGWTDEEIQSMWDQVQVFKESPGISSIPFDLGAVKGTGSLDRDSRMAGFVSASHVERTSDLLEESIDRGNLLGINQFGRSELTGIIQTSRGNTSRLIIDSDTKFQPIVIYPKGGYAGEMGRFQSEPEVDWEGNETGDYSLYMATGNWYLEGEEKARFEENIKEALEALGIDSLPVEYIDHPDSLETFRDGGLAINQALSKLEPSTSDNPFGTFGVNRFDGTVPIVFIRGMGGAVGGQGRIDVTSDGDLQTTQFAMMGDITLEALAGYDKPSGEYIFSGDKSVGGEGETEARAAYSAGTGAQMGTVMHEATHALGPGHDFDALGDVETTVGVIMSQFPELGIELFGVDGDKNQRVTISGQRIVGGVPVAVPQYMGQSYLSGGKAEMGRLDKLWFRFKTGADRTFN